MIKTPGRWIGYLSIVVVCIIVVISVWATGSPLNSRARRLDRVRSERVEALVYEVRSYYKQKGKLPESLNVVAWNAEFRSDPRTGESFGYKVLDDASFELTVTFETDSSKDRPYLVKEESARIHHHGIGPVRLRFDSVRPRSN